MTHRPTLTGTHTIGIHTRRVQADMVAHVAQSRGPQQKPVNEVSVLYLAVWVSKWSREGLKTSVALCSCCYCCLGYRSQVFFVAISTS